MKLPPGMTLLSPDDRSLLLDIADAHGTPTYVYFGRTVEERIRQLRSHLDGLPLRLLYAMKANHAVPMMRTMLEQGLGIDAVSPAELAYALAVGFPADRVFFSANNMTDEEMHYAHGKGVLLNIGELSRLEAFGKAYPGSEVCVRLNGQVGAGHHEHVITAGEKSKFGIPVEQIETIHALARQHDLRIAGLHQHIGSGIMSTETLWKAISVILDASRSFDQLRFINVGGGLGIPYRPGEQPLDMTSFDRLIVAPLKAFIASHPSSNLQIWFEPGRFFTAESGVLLARVNTVKEGTHRTFAGTDSGMNHLVRPAMYGAYHHVVNLTRPDGPERVYDVVGNICESSDFFAKDRAVAELREGDIIGVLDAGAYGMSMTTRYNMRSEPAEIWITQEGSTQIIRDRLTLDQLVEFALGAR
ncbi:MAG: diaminopimelate decarboxylase [Bacteroidetes bacterium]|nr:diaminopimelate decarboxylase [Bacteroidota bacterium]MDA0874085.1 diaminopimelate decarboxylase [Bacteroidota bacterium]